MTSGNFGLQVARGTRMAGVGFRVGSSVGGRAPRPRRHRAGTPGLRSLPAKQHAPKARPLPATDRGRRGVVRAGRQGRMACGLRPARRRGAGHSPLTAGHRAAPAPRAFRRAWWPARRGEGPPRTPLRPAARPGVTNRWPSKGEPAWRTERNSDPSKPAEQPGGRIVTLGLLAA